MNNIIFIVGTDTDVGKTIFSNMFSIYIKEKFNKNIILTKPIQSGCKKGYPSDLDIYLKLGGNKDKEQNIYCFKTPCSIDYASEIDNVKINRNKIINSIISLSKRYELVIVETAGGIMSPITKDYLFLDLIKRFSPKIILVSKIILGMINQTLLSINILKQNNLDISALVFNNTSNKKIDDKNLKSIESIINFSKIKNYIITDYKKNIMKNKDYFFKQFHNIYNSIF